MSTPTTLTIAGTLIQGSVPIGGYQPGRHQVDRQEHRVFGQKGATEIVGEEQPMDCSVIVWLNGFANQAALQVYVEATLPAMLGTSGTLELSGAIGISILNVTFDSFEPIDHNGQSGALPSNITNPSAPWSQYIRCNFRRLQA